MTATVKPIESRMPDRRRFTREEYERAAQAGVFGPEERLELIHGEVVHKMSPQNSPHATGIRLCELALMRAFTHGFDVRPQLPFVISDHTQVEPDVAVVTGTCRDYRDAHPNAATLIVEVADTSLAFDRTVKAGLYASARVAEYWVLNLVDHTLEVYRQPRLVNGAHQYAEVTLHGPDDAVTPLAASTAIKVSDLLP